MHVVTSPAYKRSDRIDFAEDLNNFSPTDLVDRRKSPPALSEQKEAKWQNPPQITVQNPIISSREPRYINQGHVVNLEPICLEYW
jgi:hypothetical protein